VHANARSDARAHHRGSVSLGRCYDAPAARREAAASLALAPFARPVEAPHRKVSFGPVGEEAGGALVPSAIAHALAAMGPTVFKEPLMRRPSLSVGGAASAAPQDVHRFGRNTSEASLLLALSPGEREGKPPTPPVAAKRWNPLAPEPAEAEEYII